MQVRESETHEAAYMRHREEGQEEVIRYLKRIVEQALEQGEPGKDAFMLVGLVKQLSSGRISRRRLGVRNIEIRILKRLLETHDKKYKTIMRIKRRYNELWLEEQKFFLFRSSKKLRRLAHRVAAMVQDNHYTYEECGIDEEHIERILGE